MANAANGNQLLEAKLYVALEFGARLGDGALH
jgi:hypothetical protein